MEPLDIKEEFIRLRAKGYSYDKVAKQLKKSKVTLVEWGKDLQEEIANHKALELEALYEKYYLLKEHKIKLFGNALEKMKAELEGRDLADIPTDKLFDLMARYHSLLQEEFTEPVFKTNRESKAAREEREILDSLTSPPQRLKVA